MPRTYPVPERQSRAGTQYWNLATGSKIGYTFVAAQNTRKPFPVIFLQGGPGSYISDLNIKLLSKLSEDGYDVYLYDQIGSGQSDRLRNIREYTAERHKKDLEDIVKQIGAEKVILIGQSWGAILATLFAADNPGKIDRIIFTGAGPIYPVRKELFTIPPPDSLHLKKPDYSNRQGNEKCANLRTRTVAFWAETFGIKLAGDQEMDHFQTFLDGELRKAVVCDSSNAQKPQGGGGFYAAVMTIQSLAHVKDPRPQLKNSPIPILVMKGQCDSQPWGVAQEYLDLFPKHRLSIIPDAGHSISVEQPELYLKIIRQFLADAPPQ